MHETCVLPIHSLGVYYFPPKADAILKKIILTLLFYAWTRQLFKKMTLWFQKKINLILFVYEIIFLDFSLGCSSIYIYIYIYIYKDMDRGKDKAWEDIENYRLYSSAVLGRKTTHLANLYIFHDSFYSSICYSTDTFRKYDRFNC
jgi:hypothetical protein